MYKYQPKWNKYVIYIIWLWDSITSQLQKITKKNKIYYRTHQCLIKK